jgi:putative peptide zinc metalloprotease protein
MTQDSAITPKLREDILITPLSGKERGSYVLEDHLRNLFFKIGEREYRFLCYLEGGGAIEDLPEQLKTGDNAQLSQDEAVVIVQWLVAKQLLQEQSAETLKKLDQFEQQARTRANWMSRFNPIVFRVPLFNPDPLLSRLSPWISWLAGPVFAFLWLMLGIVSVVVLLTNWRSFIDQWTIFFSSVNLLKIGVIWVVLKLLHELGHAVACTRQGGRVYEMGVLFILFIPLTYVNASSSWSFPSRWQRIRVAGAGMFMELFVAWLAILYWASHMDTPLGLIAHHTVLIAGVSSLLFNANPLMRFDGYYILSDLVGVPNLYYHGLNQIRRTLDSWWFGVSALAGQIRFHALLWLYGLGVYIWRILVIASLSVLACSLLGGWGLLLTISALGAMTVQFFLTFLKKITVYRKSSSKIIGHFLIRFVCVGLLSVFLLFGVNYRKMYSAPAVVVYQEQYSIRSETSGFIKAIEVEEGQQVNAGQLLVILENDELENSLADCLLQLEALKLQQRQAYAEKNYSASQVFTRQREVLLQQKENLEADHRALRIISPGDGIVVGDFSERLNTYLYKGEELFQVVHPDDKLLIASVDQDHISSFRGQQQLVEIDMNLSGQGITKGLVKEVAPEASTKVYHFSFAAQFGGPLDVKEVSGNKEATDLAFFSPRFTVKITLPEIVRQYLYHGQQLTINYRGAELSPARHIWRAIKIWYMNKKNRQGGEQ